MLRLYAPDTPSLPDDTAPLPDAAAIQAAVWIDLDCPTPDEVLAVEQALGIDLPTPEDMVEIEASSRVYREGEALFMTVLLLAGMDKGMPKSGPVCFALAPAGQLVTVRLVRPKSFDMAHEMSAKRPLGDSGRAVLLALLDMIVDRVADVLEMLGGRIDDTGAEIFGRGAAAVNMHLSPLALQVLLRQIGDSQFALNKVHESLQTLQRLPGYLSVAEGEAGVKPARGERELLKSLSRDIASLIENSSFMMQNLFFLLDAAVGRISIEQNVIVKILSFASIVLMPPTLIAGIYGMNFEHMPELRQPWAYPLVLVVMLLSAVLPLVYCRRKGWL